MNILQSIAVEEFGPVLVTLNPPFPPHKSKTAGSWTYEHPLYTEEVGPRLYLYHVPPSC